MVGILDLKPCPFCGAMPKISKQYNPETHFYTVISCDACLQSVVTKPSEEETIKTWNTRAECKCNHKIRSTNEES